ncbi:MAG: acyltransferase [Clostridia bacterium]|nr:acyltransferase [Clostridia bacterium]
MAKIARLFKPGENKSAYADAGDFLRVVSIAFIAWFHIWQQSWLDPNIYIGRSRVNLYPLVSCGYMLVDLMLLLSGFLLMLGYLNGRNRRAGDFYLGRVSRIFPCYYLTVFIMFFAFALPKGLFWNAKQMWGDLLSHLSFTHVFFYDYYIGTKLNAALWTVAVEMHFYLLFPFLAKLFERKPAHTYCGMALIGVCAKLILVYFVGDTGIYFNRLPAMMDVYANGMLAAYVYKHLCDRVKVQKKWDAWVCTALTVISAVLIYKIVHYQQVHHASGTENIRFGQMLLRFPLTLSGAVFLVCGSRSIFLIRKLFSNRVVLFLSGISFNFYMWHQFLALRLKEWRIPPYTGTEPFREGQQPWQTLYTLACFAFAVIVSIGFTYLVEKPCAKWIKKKTSLRKNA